MNEKNDTQVTTHVSPFTQRKLILDQSIKNEKINYKSLQQKSSNDSKILPIGTELVALIDNQCVTKQKEVKSQSKSLSEEIVSNQSIYHLLDKQAYLFLLKEDLDSTELEEKVNNDPCVIGMSYNRKYELQAIYNDPGNIYQSHLASIRLPISYDNFYDPLYGMPKTYNGREVIIAIIDTGVDYTHPDLIGRMWKHKDGIGVDASTIGTSLVDYNPMDISSISHGTHVAGIAAAAGDNGIGITGVMPFFAKIMAIRVFYKNGDNSETTTSAVVANGIRFAHLNGADVINLSLGRITAGADTDPFYLDAIFEAINKQIFVSSSIGNANAGAIGKEIDGVSLSSFPGMYGEQIEGMVTVGSINSNNNEWSQFGHYSAKYVEIAAPGAEDSTTGIYSTVKPVPYHQNQLYSRLLGTSMSSPMVAGAAALTIGLLRNTFGIKPKAAEVEKLITSSAISDPRLNKYFKQGRRLDMQNLVQLIRKVYPETMGGSISFSSLNCP